MTPTRFRPSPLSKATLFSGKQEGKPVEELFVEILEPRVLFSAAPVESGEVSEAATVQEANPTPSAVAPAELGDAGTSAATPDLELLSLEVVESLAAEARQRWIDSGISAEQVSASRCDPLRHRRRGWRAPRSGQRIHHHDRRRCGWRWRGSLVHRSHAEGGRGVRRNEQRFGERAV